MSTQLYIHHGLCDPPTRLLHLRSSTVKTHPLPTSQKGQYSNTHTHTLCTWLNEGHSSASFIIWSQRATIDLHGEHLSSFNQFPKPPPDLLSSSTCSSYLPSLGTSAIRVGGSRRLVHGDDNFCVKPRDATVSHWDDWTARTAPSLG